MIAKVIRAGINTLDAACALNVSARRIGQIAQKENWSPIGRQCPGGIVYDRASVSTETLAKIDALLAERAANALAKQQVTARNAGMAVGAALTIAERVSAAVTKHANERGLARTIGLQGKARTRMEQRVLVVALFERYHQAHGGALTPALQDFSRAWREGKIEADADLLQGLPTLSTSSLKLWQKRLRSEGAARLAGLYGKRRGTSAIDTQPAIRQWVVGLLQDRPHVKAEHVHQTLCAQFRSQLIETTDAKTGEVVMAPAKIPAERSLSRWLARYKREQHAAHAKNTNPDAYRNHYQVAFGSRSEGIVRLNQLWEADATPVDIITLDGRYAVIGVIDVCSRRIKLHVAKTSTGVAVGLTYRRAILDWGVPECIKSDNGKDFISRHIEVACANLRIEQKRCDKFSPDQKPHIERTLGTFLHDLVELCDGYIGHSVSERQAIRARTSFAQRQGGAEPISIRITAAALQEFCDNWADLVYGRRPHEGLNGKSPFEVAASQTAPVRRVEDERGLDILLAEAPDRRTREVRKKGILIGTNYFIAPELGACIKDTVLPLHDPSGDAGRIIVYSLEGDFICIAECPEMTGISRAEVAAKAKQVQKAFTAAATAEAKAAAKRFKNTDLVKLIIEDAAARAENVVMMPQASVPHKTPALAEAARAAARLAEMAPTERRTPRLVASSSITEEDQAAFEARHAARHRRLEIHELRDDDDLHERWIEIDAERRGGKVLSDDEERFWKSWQTSVHFRVMAKAEAYTERMLEERRAGTP